MAKDGSEDILAPESLAFFLDTLQMPSGPFIELHVPALVTNSTCWAAPQLPHGTRYDEEAQPF